MKRLALSLAALLALPLASRARPAVADLFKVPDVDQATLSPDGKHVAFVSGADGERVILFDVEQGTRRALPAVSGETPVSITARIVQARWVGPTRLLLTYNYSSLGVSGVTIAGGITTATGTSLRTSSGAPVPAEAVQQIQTQTRPLRSFSGFAAVEITGNRWMALPGVALRSDTLPQAIETTFSWAARKIFVPLQASGVVLAPAFEGRPSAHPHVARIDTVKGEATRLLANPGTVTEWIFDVNGRGAIGVDARGATTKLVRAEKPGGKWITVADLGAPRARLRLLAFDGARGVVYASRPNDAGRWELAAFKLKEAQWTPPFAQNERYDMAVAAHRPMFAGLDLSQPLFSPKTGLPFAVGLVGERPRQNVQNPGIRIAQQELAAAHPDLVTYVVEVDASESRALTLTWGPRHPGFFSVVDLATKKTQRVAERMPTLAAAELGETAILKLKARDGAVLDGYVTRPPGAATGPLPLVVLMRESPWMREAWTFSPQVQLLATRGYAVLQVNHRGSSGYGDAFLRAGRENIAGVPLDDVIDAVRECIAQGLVDPQRVAVAGSHFGGFGTLMLLARAPELFRCGVALNAITDWRELHRAKDSPPYRYWFDVQDVFPGERTEERLAQASPITVAGRITAPVMFAQAENDARLSLRATKAMISVMKSHGRAPETFFHGTPLSDRAGMAKKQIETSERMLAFLAQHMTPTTTKTSAPAAGASAGATAP